jgi:SAM-dependent methyltransferase
MYQVESYLEENNIKSFKKISIIDIGGANSCLQFYYAMKGVDYTNVDLNEDVFDKKIAKKLCVNISYITNPFERIKVDKSFDLVLCVSTMEHTKERNQKRILEKIAKVLKASGRAIFTLDWFFDYKIGEKCLWGHNPNCKKLIETANKLGLRLIIGDKKYLSGYKEFVEKDIKKDAFVLKVCNKGVWLTSLAFVLEKR